MTQPRAYVQIVIIRHTQTNHNVHLCYSGHSDIGLNEKGIQQAQELACELGRLYKPRMIVASDLSRASMTATILREECKIPFMLQTAALREVDAGYATGKTKEEAFGSCPAELHNTNYRHYDFGDVGGECSNQVIARQVRFLEQLTHVQIPDELLSTVFLVGHDTALRSVFVDYLKLLPTLHKQGDYQTVLYQSQSQPHDLF